jgi:hypothetical protein
MGSSEAVTTNSAALWLPNTPVRSWPGPNPDIVSHPGLVDFYCESFCRIWLQLVSQGDTLEPETIANYAIYDGSVPQFDHKSCDSKSFPEGTMIFELAESCDGSPHMDHWLDYEIQGSGWNDFLGLGWNAASHPQMLFTHNEPLEWAERENIYPYQPFLVHIHKPRYYQDYCGEWDAEYHYDIVYRGPVNPDYAAWAFEDMWRKEEPNELR